MGCRRRHTIPPIIALLAVLAACTLQTVSSKRHAYRNEYDDESSPRPSRRLEIAVTNSDEYAESILTVQAPKFPLGIGEHDHAKISSILSMTKEMIDTANVLVNDERTLKEGQDMMERANGLFREVKEHILHSGKEEEDRVDRKLGGGGEEEYERHDMIRKSMQRYSNHDMQEAEEDSERALDVARMIYETMVTFPECVGQLYDDCLAIINGEIASLGLSTIEVVTHEKRNADQEGYNKVVIITNELADRVKGHAGDGIVIYPFMWADSQSGQRSLGVDGKWNCHDLTPEDCCEIIKTSVPTADVHDKHIECHIFVPYGGVGNPRRSDRVFINLSPDGRVHEPPVIQ